MFSSRTHYINYFRRLINMEREADIKRHVDEINKLSGTQREKKGRALLNMRGKRAGRLYGNQHLVKYMKMDIGQPLPDLDMSIGDVVVISQGHPLKKGNPLGTIVEKGNHAVTVLFDGTPDKWMIRQGLRVDLYVNDVTYRRMQEALDIVMYGRECSPRLMSWIIGEKDKYIPPRALSESAGARTGQSGAGRSLAAAFYNEKLNDSQKSAVCDAISAEDFYIVHGPPGTGKTVTGVEILCQAKDRYGKVLASADSNGAVDNVALGLVNYDVKVVRIGQPFKVHKALQDMTLDAQMLAHPEYGEVERLREEAFRRMKDQEEHKHPSPRWTRGMKHTDIHRLAKRGKGSRGVSPADMKSMSKWLKIREDVDKCFSKADALEAELTQDILQRADVILCTNSGAAQSMLEGWEFDLVLIDEATQSTESSAMIPAVKGKRLILLGDHKQLPPTVISQEADENGFSVSLLERLVERYGDSVVTMLTTQYRMNESIMAYPNEMFYERRLAAGDQNRDWHLDVTVKEKWLDQFVKSGSGFVHVAGKEKRLGDSPSVMNVLEAETAREVVELLIAAGVEKGQIGVISPYKAQVKLIKTLLDDLGHNIQVDTVDGFQGQEKDVIVISFVRSNDDGYLGFLNDVRRLNVALTRAKKLRIAIGNQDTIRSHNVYGAFLDGTDVLEK